MGKSLRAARAISLSSLHGSLLASTAILHWLHSANAVALSTHHWVSHHRRRTISTGLFTLLFFVVATGLFTLLFFVVATRLFFTVAAGLLATRCSTLFLPALLLAIAAGLFAFLFLAVTTSLFAHALHHFIWSHLFIALRLNGMLFHEFVDHLTVVHLLLSALRLRTACGLSISEAGALHGLRLRLGSASVLLGLWLRFVPADWLRLGSIHAHHGWHTVMVMVALWLRLILVVFFLIFMLRGLLFMVSVANITISDHAAALFLLLLRRVVLVVTLIAHLICHH